MEDGEGAAVGWEQIRTAGGAGEKAGMDKDSTGAMPRRHRLGPGAPPTGSASGGLKAASETAELQRSRSMGGLPQKGNHPPQVQKLSTAPPESAERGRQLRSEAEERGCQAPLEDGEQNKDQAEDALETPAPEEAGGPQHGEEDPKEAPDRREQKLSVFVEVDLGDHTEEAATRTTKEEKLAQADLGDLSGDE
ncbi:uncharacterized protein C13orf46 homolog [Sorex araneus]|uniref:uncharacterized protein C13orf46 homolog n=1 Tax=Sorex araneus TaxID=42254 RepID=UPI002433DC23|nr:uncharacterized protein C13orf46 homolog [Sorex araneus]